MFRYDVAKEFVFSQRLAAIAADPLGVTGVRPYHDQALYKESGGGITPWHADQFYWPLSSDRTVTVWVPLQETPDPAEANFPLVVEPFTLGDVSFHTGWTFHRAGANKSGSPRAVMTVIYMDEDITLIEPTNEFHKRELVDWLPGADIGKVPSGPLNPVLYSSK